MPPTPLILLTGFLGAGKTTMLNRALSLPELRKKKLAVIVNEFGALGVDGALLKPGNYSKYEINKGSIFCICMKTDLISVFNDIQKNVRPDMVLIEATGLAEPRDLASVLQMPDLAEAFRLTTNVCLVDPSVFPKISRTMRTSVVQVREADVLLLNKCDLADNEELDRVTAELREINPRAAIHRTTFAQAPAGVLLKGAFEHDWSKEPRTAPDPDVHSIPFLSRGVLDRTRFYRTLESWGGRLLRAKGVVQFDDGQYYVEQSGGPVSTSRNLPPSAIDAEHATAFVVVVRDAPEKEILAALRSCEL